MSKTRGFANMQIVICCPRVCDPSCQRTKPNPKAGKWSCKLTQSLKTDLAI